MSEERGLEVDLPGYEVAKQAAQLASQGISGAAEDRIALDVHSITELQEKGVKPTDDSPKHNYKASGPDPGAKYIFEGCQGKIIALR